MWAYSWSLTTTHLYIDAAVHTKLDQQNRYKYMRAHGPEKAKRYTVAVAQLIEKSTWSWSQWCKVEGKSCICYLHQCVRVCVRVCVCILQYTFLLCLRPATVIEWRMCGFHYVWLRWKCHNQRQAHASCVCVCAYARMYLPPPPPLDILMLVSGHNVNIIIIILVQMRRTVKLLNHMNTKTDRHAHRYK